MNPQPLTIQAVRQVAEDLMSRYGNTTTLDVKNNLRNRNYFATQQEVSAHMDTLAITDNWLYNQTGGHRVYRLSPDTNKTIDGYYHKQNEVIEVYLEGKELHIGTGKKGSQLAWQVQTFSRNNTAHTEAQQFVKQKLAEGFLINNSVPAYHARLQLRNNTHDKVQKIKLGVYDFMLSYHYEMDNNQVSENIYSVGGYFSWEKDDFEAIANDIAQKKYTSTLFQKAIFNANGKKLTAKNIRPKQPNEIINTTFVEVHQGKIYEAVFVTNTGKNITLNKYKEGNYDDFLQKIQNILQHGFVYF